MAYIVKAQYGRYIINDESYSSIFVTTGNTIIFDVSHSSNADHPLKISTTKDGTHGVDENGNPGTELNDATAIVNNGVPGEPNAQIMFTPALDGIFYYYCEHHANMGSSITSVQTKFTDLGATAYDAQDGDITNRITKKIYKKDENNVFQLVASIDDSHGNPWEVLDIDITEQASYKIEYNAKGLDNIDASNQPLERYINIITSAPTLAQLLIGNTFWLVNGLDENGVGYTDAGTDASFWGNHLGNFCIVNPAGGVTVPGTRSTRFSATWTEPNHGRYPPAASGYTRLPHHWRGQVTFLDESNYVGWTADTEEKDSGGAMSNGNYTVDDTGVSFQLYTIDGNKTFKIKLTSEDQLQDGAITRCDDFKRIVYDSTMTMVSAIKCAEGDVPNTADFKASPHWTGSGDLTWY